MRLNLNRALPAFVNQFLNTPEGYRYRLSFIRQVAVSGVSAEDVASFLVPCPRNLEEQIAIMERLEVVDSRMLVEHSILAKLRKTITGLMQDLLTGKVRVKVDEEATQDA